MFGCVNFVHVLDPSKVKLSHWASVFSLGNLIPRKYYRWYILESCKYFVLLMSHFFFSHSIRVCLLISFLVMRWSTSLFSFNIISFRHIALQHGILVLNTIKPFFFGSYNHVSPCMYFFTYITSLISIPSDLSSNFFLTIKKKKNKKKKQEFELRVFFSFPWKTNNRLSLGLHTFQESETTNICHACHWASININLHWSY